MRTPWMLLLYLRSRPETQEDQEDPRRFPQDHRPRTCGGNVMRTPACYALGSMGLGTVAWSTLCADLLPRVQIVAAARPTGQPPAPFRPHLLRRFASYPLVFQVTVIRYRSVIKAHIRHYTDTTLAKWSLLWHSRNNDTIFG